MSIPLGSFLLRWYHPLGSNLIDCQFEEGGQLGDTASTMKAKFFEDLAKYPLCNFYLQDCVESMSHAEVKEDLEAESHLSLLQHFDQPDQMCRLEDLFAKTLETFCLSKEELKGKAQVNFDTYDMKGFESVRAVFRVANALSEAGFTELAFLGGKGLADLKATKDGQRWFIEVKALVLQTKPQEFEVDGKTETLAVDRFQPESCNIAEYVNAVCRLVAGNHIQKARKQLLNTVEIEGAAKKMAAIAVNLFAADFFLDSGNLNEVEARLHGKREGWGKDYLVDIDALAFITNSLYLSCYSN